MKARVVFVDTNIFYQYKCNLDHPHFKSLRDLGSRGGVTILLPQITKREVLRQINEEHAPELASRLRKAHNLLSEFNWVHDQTLPDINCSKELIAEKIVDKLEDFLATSKAKILDNDFPVSKILDQYFDRLPPFSHKPNEFADAIALQNLNLWLSLNPGEKVTIVSTDQDFDGVGKNFSRVSNLREFIDDTLTEENFVADAKKAIWSDKETLEKFIEKEGAPRIEFDALGFESATVNGSKLLNQKLKDISVVDYSQSDGFLEMEVRSEMTFELDVEHEDLDTASWDNEDGKWIIHSEVREDWEICETQSFFIHVSKEEDGTFTLVDCWPEKSLVSVWMPEEYLK